MKVGVKTFRLHATTCTGDPLHLLNFFVAESNRSLLIDYMYMYHPSAWGENPLPLNIITAQLNFEFL